LSSEELTIAAASGSALLVCSLCGGMVGSISGSRALHVCQHLLVVPVPHLSPLLGPLVCRPGWVSAAIQLQAGRLLAQWRGALRAGPNSQTAR
jgi:hypothetical protein